MEKRRLFGMGTAVVISILLILALGLKYVSSVKMSLWEQAVEDVLEITSQGSHAFDVYISRNIEMVHNLRNNLARSESENEESIIAKMSLRSTDENDYILVDIDKGYLYTSSDEKRKTLGRTELAKYKALEGSGITGPGISDFTGRNVISCYERFEFSDGCEAVIVMEMLLSLVSEEFSISFYDGKGFSNIVDNNGKVIVRSGNKISDHTIENIFDTIDPDGSDQVDIADFQEALRMGEAGVTKLMYQGDEYVYTYVPAENPDDWNFISIIPNSVIMRSAERVVKSSKMLLFFIALGIVIFSAFMLMMKQSYKSIRGKEKEIRYREQLFNILSNNTDDVFIMFTEQGAVEYVSPNIEKVMGISAEDVEADLYAVNRTLCRAEDSISPDDLANIEPGTSKIFESERYHAVSGEKKWFSDTFYCEKIDNESKMIAVLSDRTKEMTTKNALEDALSIAKSANEAKSSFLSNMSHDIRTPMNAIIVLSKLLQRDVDDPEKVREHTRKIVSSSQHMLGIINDILDMSKIESGKATLNIAEFSLADLVEDLRTIIRPQAKAKHQQFDITVRDIQQEHLMGDKLRIEQIMINLLSNSVKYTPDEGKVEMMIRQISRDTKIYASMQFVVRDNGIGMSKEYQKTLFAPFSRETNSVTNKVQGTGLGMAITKNLVDLMGGTITVESEKDKGSTFIVDLEFRMQSRDIDRKFWISHGITRILAAGSTEEERKNISGSMAGTGVSVLFTPDGESAVRAVIEASQSGADFHLVILNREMRDIYGIEAARQIKEALPDKLPIMMLTAYDKDDLEDKAAAAGINGSLIKPFFMSNLKQAVENIRSDDSLLSASDDNSYLENKKFLIAEDNEINAEILLELLSDVPSLTCVTVENGKEALDIFAGSEPNEFDVIIMDVQMPVMNGYEATRAIRALNRPDAKSIPIIAMTANAFAEDVKAALDSGMNAHVSKPVDIGKIFETLRKFLQK